MTRQITTLSELLTAYRNREISCVEFVQQQLQRLDAMDHINAIVAINRNTLLLQAQSCDDRLDGPGPHPPLLGVPLVLKANIDTAELVTSAATPALVNNVPPFNAPVAQLLIDAGAIIFGKTNMHELAFGITNNNGVHGACHNPWNTDLIPGGSSGGSAAAVAAGIVPAGLGTDTGGSVRLPAALCGICGFRPTMGRYPGDGIVPISHTRDTAGPMARSVQDLILLDSVLAATTPAPQGDPRGLRVGVPRDYYYDNLEPEVAAVVEEALAVLADMGVELVEKSVEEVEELNNLTGFPVALYEARRDMAAYLAASAPALTVEDVAADICSPDVRAIYASVMQDEIVPEDAYRHAIEVHRPRLQRAFQDYFSNNYLDAIAIPTTPVTARPIGDDDTIELNGERVPTMATIIRCTDPSSNAGIPSLSVAAAIASNGLPVGICLEGPMQSDNMLLQLGRAFQDRVGVLPLPGDLP